MARRRYQPPKSGHADEGALPLDTVCTILTRQSTLLQGTRNVFSAEVNPSDLVAFAERLGFSPDRIRLVDADMGIGAYSTVIEDRPGLHQWLYEALPRGESRVVLVSQEDRLFRDETEIEHNRFIAQVVKHGGWVICGQTVYDFRHDFDRERFRMACRYGKQYIEHHVKGRLHPALQRAAMQGRYVGGRVAWGYIVDYLPASPTFKHLRRYEPHAVLVLEQVFRRFANMPYPSVGGLVRLWWQERRVFPFFGAEVDSRSWAWLNATCRRDEALGGYPLSWEIATSVLTDVTYLGWRVRAGEVARDGGSDAPRVCHEPLVDADLFWWCYDRVLDERPAWAPPRTTTALIPARPRRVRATSAARDDVRFLGHGMVRCAKHGLSIFPLEVGPNGTYLTLRCGVTGRDRLRGPCHVSLVEDVESAMSQAFTAQLTLSDEDVQQLALWAEQRAGRQGDEVAELDRHIAEHRSLLERAKQATLQAPDLRAEFLEAMRHEKQTIADLEARRQAVQQAVVPSSRGYVLAQRAVELAERIRTTFPQWARQWQQAVLALALHDAVIGNVDRYALGVWMQWEGGAISRHQLQRPLGKKQPWTPDEDAALCAYFDTLTLEMLTQMLPGRRLPAICARAYKLGLSRKRGTRSGAVLPVVVQASEVVNEMAAYGFPLATVAERGGNTTNKDSPSSSSRRRPWYLQLQLFVSCVIASQCASLLPHLFATS